MRFIIQANDKLYRGSATKQKQQQKNGQNLQLFREKIVEEIIVVKIKNVNMEEKKKRFIKENYKRKTKKKKNSQRV